MNYLIGVDLGTQSIKAGLMSEKGVLIAEYTEETNIINTKDGGIEQDPEEMFNSVLTCIKKVFQKAKTKKLIKKSEIASICMDGQMAGIMGIDKKGMAVTPYDSWLDTRCSITRKPFLDFGEEKIIKITGGPVSFTHGPKIIWQKKFRKEIYKKIYKFVQPAVYCTMRLCGLVGDDAFIDYTYLHFSGFSDTKNMKWSDEIIKALKMDKNKFPKIIRPFDVVGRLTKKFAEKTGLLSGIKIVAGMGDTAATSFGAGITKKNLCFDIAGTASVMAFSTNKFTPDIKNKTLLFAPSVMPNLYTAMGYVNGGGLCIRWVRDKVFNNEFSYDALEKMAKKIKAGSENLFFIPHFYGRITPNDNLVRGAFINLSFNHKTGHLYRSVLEGIVYEYLFYYNIIKKLIPDQKFKKIISIGGASKSELFAQIKSDALSISLEKGQKKDTALLACCSVAGFGVGLFDKIDKLVQKTKEPTVLPNKGNSKIYSDKVKIYEKIISDLRSVYAKILEEKR
ncbi:MAG: hypothetical protein LBD41_02425 [Clostridiales Family XIII bacterium]|jgi:xylulokinase|nr:hypothetical protein [Clostridiales Family XIII bacterium]